MATFTVTTLNDSVNASDGVLSLREAVAQANATSTADVIRFASSLGSGTLTLTQGELRLTQDVTIDGDTDTEFTSGFRVTISGGDVSRILHSDGVATDVALRNLTLTHGSAQDGNGGAVLLAGGSLNLDDVSVGNSRADSGVRGGGLYAADGTRVQIRGSQFFGNYVDFPDDTAGGAIATGTGVDLAIRDSEFTGNTAWGEFGYGGGAIYLGSGGALVLEDTILRDNAGTYGGGLRLVNATAEIARSTFTENGSYAGGAILASSSNVSVTDSTIAGNGALAIRFDGFGGGVGAIGGQMVVRNSTITGNRAEDYYSAGSGGGIGVSAATVVDIANSIVAGNSATDGPDISGTIDISNGHNVFGSDVIGNVAGDREGIAASTLFTTGLANGDGVVALRSSASNPALGGALSFDSLGTDQLGHARPVPSSASPEVGAVELTETLSTVPTANNDVLTGTSAANTISGGLGNDRILGLAGNDTLNGNDGSDTFDGGTGNDKINGGTGVDIALYGGTTAVVFDLSGTTDRVTQGSAVDTLTSVEGGAGGSGADTFRGDAANNYFRGGDGRDTFTGAGGRDTYYYTSAQNSPATTGRDVITDFVHGQDKINLARIDPDSAHAGDQAFRWLGHAALGTTPGDLAWFSSGGNTIVQGNTDTDTAAEFWIQLNGNVGPSLTAADFIL